MQGINKSMIDLILQHALEAAEEVQRERGATAAVVAEIRQERLSAIAADSNAAKQVSTTQRVGIIMAATHDKFTLVPSLPSGLFSFVTLTKGLPAPGFLEFHRMIGSGTGS